MMINLIKIFLLAIAMLVLFIGVFLLIGLGLNWVLQYLPCEFLLYIFTGLLLGIFMLLISFFVKPGTFPNNRR